MVARCNNCEKLLVLQKENLLLKRKLDFGRKHPKLVEGLRGEKFILSLTKGEMTVRNDASDIILKNGKHVEVKFSSLNELHYKSKIDGIIRPTCKRWTWNRVLGGKRRSKDWDYLMLVGEKDDIYYPVEEDGAAFIFFFLDRRAAKEVITKSNSINLTLSPRSSSKGGKLLKYRLQFKNFSSLLKKLESDN